MIKFYTRFLLSFILSYCCYSELQAVTLINEPFTQSSLPSNWTKTDISYETGGGGYQRLKGSTAKLTSPLITNWDNYEDIVVTFEVAKYGSGNDGPITLEVSNDGGLTWTAFVKDGAIPPNSKFVNSTINIPNDILNNNIKIRFTTVNSPSEKRFKNLVVTGNLKSLCTAPTSAPEAFSSMYTATETTITFEWLNGTGDGRVIKMNTIDSFTDITSGDDPASNTTYLGGEQVVYNGTGSGPITVTGLLPNTQYFFKGYEYCAPDRVYTSGNAESITTQMGANYITTSHSSFGPFCSGVDHPISVEFTHEGIFTGEFKVQLSDAHGVFSTNLSENIIGTGNSSPISAILPSSTLAGAGYRIRVINEDPLSIGFDNGNDIEIFTTPSIPNTIVPASICEGSTITITAAGSTNATSYTFWDSNIGGHQITNGVSDGILTLDNTTPHGIYTYYIQAENGVCVSERQEVNIEIIEQPSLPSGSFGYTANPSCGSVKISYDNGYYFQTSISGTSFEYSTNSNFTLEESGKVYVRAYNGSCWSEAVESDFVEVFQPIAITTQPANISVASNASGQMSIVAYNVISYQWQSNDGCGWTNITGATNNNYSIVQPTTDMTGTLYRVILTGEGICGSIVSESAELTVTTPVASSISSIYSDATSGSNSYLSNPYNNSPSLAQGITASGIGRSEMLSGGSAGRYNASGWTLNAPSPNHYFTFTLSPSNGNTINVDSIRIQLSRSSTGPQKFELRSSLDDFETILSTGNYTATGTYTWTGRFSTQSSTSSIEFRIYAYGGSSTSGATGIINWNFIGSIATPCTPPVITQQPNSISACYKELSVATTAISPSYQWEYKVPSTSDFVRILSCTPYMSGGQTDHLTIHGTIEDGTQFRVKVTADNCTAISDTITYSAQPIMGVTEGNGDIVLNALPCESKGWTYYSSTEQPGVYAFAINWAPDGSISNINQIAKKFAEVVISLENAPYAIEEIMNGDHFATYTMRRYWNVNTTELDEPVQIRFPYLQSEVDEIIQIAQQYVQNNSGAHYEGFKWFKLEGQAFEPISSIVTAVNINNSIPLNDVGGMFDDVLAAQFDGITSFSGGTAATGIGPLNNNPLPVELLYFLGECDQHQKVFTWATASEKNAHYFILEGSYDGKSFHEVAQVVASGQSNSLKNYEWATYSDFIYFRLKQVDFDGTTETFKTINVNCSSTENKVDAYYSTTEGFVVDITSAKHRKINLSIHAVNGQQIISQSLNVVAGQQKLTFPVHSLAKGIYILSIGDTQENKAFNIAVY